MSEDGDASRPAVDPPVADWSGLGGRAGLCRSCAHALLRGTFRGTVYLRCGAASVESGLPKYPRLPVEACDGYQPDSG